jgi:mono/diheme cytochrome c family protein
LPVPDNADAVASTHPEGAALFAGACASCHEPGAPTMLEGRPHLALGTALHEDNPRDTIHILLRGVTSPAGRAGPTMPGFDVLTDPQIALIADYLRARFTDKPPWRDLPREVAEARKESAP